MSIEPLLGPRGGGRQGVQTTAGPTGQISGPVWVARRQHQPRKTTLFTDASLGPAPASRMATPTGTIRGWQEEQEEQEGAGEPTLEPKPNQQRRASRRASEAIANALVPRDDSGRSSTPADSVAFLWQTMLIPILCSALSTALLYPLGQYARAVGDLYFNGADGLGAPAIYRNPPEILHLPEGSHLAIAPFLPYHLLKYGVVEPPGLDAFHDSFDDGYAWWKHWAFHHFALLHAGAIPNLLFVLAFFRPNVSSSGPKKARSGNTSILTRQFQLDHLNLPYLSLSLPLKHSCPLPPPPHNSSADMCHLYPVCDRFDAAGDSNV